MQLDLLTDSFSSREELEKFGYYFNFSVHEMNCLLSSGNNLALRDLAFRLLYLWCEKYRKIEDKLSLLETAGKECHLKYLLEEIQKQIAEMKLLSS